MPLPFCHSVILYYTITKSPLPPPPLQVCHVIYECTHMRAWITIKNIKKNFQFSWVWSLTCFPRLMFHESENLNLRKPWNMPPVIWNFNQKKVSFWKSFNLMNFSSSGIQFLLVTSFSVTLINFLPLIKRVLQSLIKGEFFLERERGERGKRDKHLSLSLSLSLSQHNYLRKINLVCFGADSKILVYSINTL